MPSYTTFINPGPNYLTQSILGSDGLDFFAAPKPPNGFGLQGFGGPIIKDKIWFFGSFDSRKSQASDAFGGPIIKDNVWFFGSFDTRKGKK